MSGCPQGAWSGKLGRVAVSGVRRQTKEQAMIAELRRAWLTRLLAHWHHLNRTKLGGTMLAPVLAIDQRGESRLGRWDARTRTIGISEQHIWHQPWHEVQHTLAHEVAHQFVSEVLLVTDETAHGDAFAAACARLGIPPRATLRLDDVGPGGEPERILAKVQKLLALAASDNTHEAERAMAAANTMLLKYNLSLGDVPEAHTYDWKRVGPTFAAIPLADKLVASILSEFFFVECIWVSVYNARLDREERQLELLGNPTNLALADYVHDYLHRATLSLWKKAIRTLEQRDGRAKREFAAGVLMGFRDKLRDERRGHAERGLVWVGDPQLDRFKDDRYPTTRSLGGGELRRSSALAAGRQAGSELRIHQGIHQHSSRGRQLGRD
jgi:hypothetical protein